MTALTVAGGIYRERCAFPSEWDHVFGSGGRAAVAVAGHVDDVTLRAYASEHFARMFQREIQPGDVDVRAETVTQEVEFRYQHSLSTPVIVPAQAKIEQYDPIIVSADCVLRFGMLEGTAQVTAGRCVYDPQSAFVPEPFGQNGSRADHLCIVANRREVASLGRSRDPYEAAKTLLDWGAECVVVKGGVHGADVVTADGCEHIAPYQSDNVWSVGTGDVFSAMFAARWAVHGDAPREAATLASSAVGSYADTRALPSPLPQELRSNSSARTGMQRGRVYLAGPFFTIGQLHVVEEARRLLQEFDLEVFSPFHDVGVGPAEEVAPKDIKALRDADVVFAIIDGLDSGTIFEVGYARALDKRVDVLAQTVEEGDLKMIVGSGCHVHSDLVTALHHLAWRKE